MNKVYIFIYLSIFVCPDQMIEAVLDCNFEAGFCDWKNDSMDDFDWERKTGGTSTWYTGPASDHTTESGNYIYIEASEKNKGDKSRIMSPWQVSGQYCLTFWYNMYGRDIGALNVYLFENGIETAIFNKNKNKKKGNRSWWKSVLNIETSDRYQIVIEGVIGSGSEGNIAIDDIEIKSGLCLIDCDFRYDFCNWMESYDNDFNWYRGNNATSISDGHYIYVENYGTGKSMLKSPLQNAGKFCLIFNLKYFQNGNRLQIDMRAKNGSKMYSHEPPRNQFWTPIRILISSQDPFQIVFESIFDNWRNTRIAIDEVIMSSCNNCPDPTPNHGIVNNTNFPYGSVIKIYCEHGFTLKGNSVIICRPMERWNGSAECIPHDCGNRFIPNGSFLTPNGTTFGQVGRHECDTGFVLVGKQSINCTVNGWSDTSAFCKFVDCGNLTIKNGRFITSNGTTFGQVGKFECHAGFILIGEQHARCLINGWNNSSAYCKILVSVLQTCPNDTDYMKAQWKTGRAGTFSYQKCPNGYEGEVLRYCSESGIYQDPIYNCTKSSINEIHKKFKDKVNNGSVDTDDIIDTLDNLINDTKGNDENESILKGDIDKTLDILSTITDAITVNTTNLENITNSFIANINNILGESTSETWIINVNQTGFGADVVLKNTDLFVEKIMTTNKNVTAEISDTNLYLKLGSLKTCMQALKFPKRDHEGVSEWARSRQDELIIECDGSVESFSGIIYRNISKIMPVTRNSSKTDSLQLNAPVISFTFYPKSEKKVASPVEITFQLYNNTWDNAKCSFWKESQGNSSLGYWSDEGCRQKRDDKNKDIVICVCDHLTNFAVLMNPTSSKIHEGHKKVLSYISLTGCIISIVCLVLTLAIKAYFWRFIKSVRTIIHINLSCSLLIAYILFLVGINRTENQDVCTAMAVLLHLAFLAVIFGMLTEGCNLSYTVLKPLSTRKPGIPLMIVSYVLAIITVIVSMGVTQLEGYGTEKACWLSTETGLIWAFLVPVLVVVLINAIIAVMVIRAMCSTTAMSKKSSKGRAKATLRCILILMPVMGLTWVFGALSVNEETIIFQYIFAILNSFQGMLIFVFHCLMDKKVKDAFVKQRSKWLQSQSFGVSEGRRLKTQDTSEM